jgi:hypothetical protein
MRRKTRGQQAVAIAAAAVGLLRPHDVSGAQHVAFIQSSSLSAIKQHKPREYSPPLDYSKGREEDDVKIWLPTDHIASLGSDTTSPINSHGWENFDTQQADDNYNVIDDWIDAKKRRSRRLQSLDDVNSENDKKSNYRAREQKKVNEWRRSRSQTKTPPPTQSLPQPKFIDNAAATTTSSSSSNDNNIHRLNLSYTDRSQLSAIQSNAPAILLPSGPGTGKSHVLSLRVAHLLQTPHWQHKVSNTDNNFHRGGNGGGGDIIEEGGRGGEEEVCSPDSMIILSFTNNDASRLKERALDYLYPTTVTTDDNNMMMMMKRNQTSKALWSGTMHAFSLAILNKYTSSSTPPLRVLPAREMKNRVASSLRSLLDGESNNNGDNSNNDSNVQTEGWYRELQLRHLQTLNDVGHSRSILFQNIVRCIDLWKEANMPLASADHHFIVKKGDGNGGNGVQDGEEEGVRNDCLELAMRLGIPKSSALLALDVFPEYQVSTSKVVRLQSLFSVNLSHTLLSLPTSYSL